MPAYNDLASLQSVTRKMLKKLEAALDEEVPGSETADKLRQNAHNRWFGAKVSLAETLAVTAELMLKLKAESKPVRAKAYSAGPIAESDIALMEDYVARSKAAKAENDGKDELPAS